jgi:hypothetical protein
MFSRLIYYLYFIVVVAVVAVKWRTFPRGLHLMMEGRLDAFLAFMELVLLLAMCILAAIALRRSSLSHRRARAETTVGSGNSSLRDQLHRLRTDARSAFARNPMGTSIRLLLALVVCAAVPFGLFILIHPHGFRGLAVSDWVIFGLSEFPVVFVTVVVLTDIREADTPD